MTKPFVVAAAFSHLIADWAERAIVRSAD